MLEQTSPCNVKTQNHTVNKTIFHFTGSYMFVCECMYVSALRYIAQRVPQLLSQVLYVPPLALVDRLSSQVDVVNCQLGLVKQPLHHKHRAWTGGRKKCRSDFGQHTHQRLCLAQLEKLGCFLTDFLTWERLYIQRNSSTPLPNEPVCSSLAPNRPSTCTTAKHHHYTRSALFYPPSVLVPPSVPCSTHLMPLLMASVGAQLKVSKQSVNLYCLLSRNHPESARPLTCTPLWPCDSSCSATLSTFRRTPVPPALVTGRAGSEGANERSSLLNHTHIFC